MVSHAYHVVVHTLCTIPDAVIAIPKQSMTETKEIYFFCKETEHWKIMENESFQCPPYRHHSI